VGQVDGQDAEPRPDLEHNVRRVEPGESTDDAEDVLVGEKVLSELPPRPCAHGEGVATDSAKAAVAFASMRAATSAVSSPRTSARAATVWTTLAGSFGLPRRGTGAGEGQSVSARIRFAGTRRAASRSSSAFANVTFPANET